MVLSVYLGMRYVTGGGVLAFPLNQDANGQREVIRGHSFRAREGVQYDVNAVWPLLSEMIQMLHHLLLIQGKFWKVNLRLKKGF